MSEHVTSPTELGAQLPALQALARHLCGARDPEDMVQNTVVAALSQPKAPRKVRPWLKQVLRNEVRMRARFQQRRRVREDAVAPTEAIEQPQDIIAQLELTAIVLEVLEQMDEAHRRVLRARFFEGRSAVELAAEEGCAPSTIRSRSQQALREMRKALDQRLGGRSQWMGGLLPLCGLTLESPSSSALIPTLGVTMGKATVWKTTIAIVLLVGATTAALDTASASRHDGPTSTISADAEGYAASSASHAPVAGSVAGPADPRDEAGAGAGAGPATTAFASQADKEERPKPIGIRLSRATKASVKACYRDLGRPPKGAYADLQATFAADPSGWSTKDVVVRAQKGEVPQELLDCVIESLEGETFEFEQPDNPGNDGPQRDRGVMFSVDDGSNDRQAREAERAEIMATLPSYEPAEAVAALGLEPRGHSQGKITIIECSDFDCTYCKPAAKTLRRIHEDYADEVALHWLNNPLAMHRHAELKARAGLAAQAQGKFWPMHDRLIEDDASAEEEQMIAHARALGLDEARFAADLRSEETATMVIQHQKVCRESGARGTPSIFVNDDMIIGAQPYEKFVEIIEEELATK